MAAPASGASPRLVAFRAWQLKDGLLRSLYKTCDWPLGVSLRAQCFCAALYGEGKMHVGGQKPPPHPVSPDPDPNKGECGFYAYDRLETLQAYLGSQGGQGRLVGVVVLWGQVQAGRVKDSSRELEKPGYRLRAQYARVVALDKDQAAAFPVRDGDRVEWVSQRYLEPWAADAFSGVRYSLEVPDGS